MHSLGIIAVNLKILKNSKEKGFKTEKPFKVEEQFNLMEDEDLIDRYDSMARSLVASRFRRILFLVQSCLFFSSVFTNLDVYADETATNTSTRSDALMCHRFQRSVDEISL